MAETQARVSGYPPVIKALHWLIAVLLLLVWPLGWLQKMVKEDFYMEVNFWHVTLGITLFWLMLVRVGARLSTRTPPADDGAPAWTHRMALVVQALLYVALVVQPILGLLTSDAQGFPLKWFEVIPLWNPLEKSDAAAHALLTAHGLLAVAIALLVALHIAGALYHHVLRRDATLQRIL